MLYKDEYTSGNDLVLDPSNPDIVYAALWQQQESFRESGAFGGAGNGIFKSTDGGDTWRHLTEGLPDVIQANWEQQTVLVTNLGGLGVRHFLPLISPPECGILAVGRSEARVVAREVDDAADRARERARDGLPAVVAVVAGRVDHEPVAAPVRVVPAAADHHVAVARRQAHGAAGRRPGRPRLRHSIPETTR